MTISGMKPPQSCSLQMMKAGDRGVISDIATDCNTLQSLKQMGIYRGTAIAVHQRSPTFIIKVGIQLLD